MPGPYANPMGELSEQPPAVPGGTDPEEWWNMDPNAGFWEFLRRSGLNQLNPVSRFAQGQFGRSHSMFTAAAAQNPEMGFFDYLNANPQNFNFQDQYANQDYTQRGDFSSRTLAPRARWVTPR